VEKKCNNFAAFEFGGKKRYKHGELVRKAEVMQQVLYSVFYLQVLCVE